MTGLRALVAQFRRDEDKARRASDRPVADTLLDCAEDLEAALGKPPKWSYISDNILGNLHVAAAWITEHHPEWDVVTMHFSGSATVVVYREEQL